MSVARMKDGKRWYCFVRYKDWRGQTKQHKKEGFRRKSDAQAYEREFRQRVSGAPEMTVSAMYTIYMDDCVSRLRPSTVQTKKDLFKHHVLPDFADVPISAISPATVRQWQNTLLQKGLKPSTLRMINGQLSALLNFAVKFYGLSNNPCKLAGQIGSLKTEEMRIWTPEQFDAFFSSLRDHTARALFHLLYWSGLRIGEALALTPGDFDFSVPSVRVTKTYHRIDGRDVITPPKTPKSERTVMITKESSALMQRYISTLFDCDKKTRIFGLRSKTWYRSQLQAGCRAAQLEPIRIHDLRHSHASLMVELGYSPLLIAERLGHESAETTLRTYSHLYPNKQRDFIERLDRLKFAP